MKQDLLNKWFDTTDFEFSPLGRLSRRRRIRCPDEEELNPTSQPPSPSVSPKALSDDYRYKDLAHRDKGSYFRHTIDSIYSRLRTRKSDSFLVDSKGVRALGMVRAQSMPRKPKGSGHNVTTSVGNSENPSQSTPSVATGSDDTQGSKQTGLSVANTEYRSEVLALNGVFFKSPLDPLPVEIATVVKKSLLRRRAQDMDYTTAKGMQEKFIQARNHAEAGLTIGFLTTGILPAEAPEMNLSRIHQMPFTNATLPRANVPETLSVTIQSICQPKPDVAYGYTLEGIESSQQIAQNSTFSGVDLSKYSRPAKDFYWPFFVVEFKAPSVGGTVFAAENQCAGGGSALLMAAHALYTAALQAKACVDLADSIAYSAAIDGAIVNLHVHWYDAGRKKYYLEEVRNYNFKRHKDIQKFYMHTRNIVDWGLGERLEKIKTALDVILADDIKKKQGQKKRAGGPLSRPTS